MKLFCWHLISIFLCYWWNIVAYVVVSSSITCGSRLLGQAHYDKYDCACSSIVELWLSSLYWCLELYETLDYEKDLLSSWYYYLWYEVHSGRRLWPWGVCMIWDLISLKSSIAFFLPFVLLAVNKWGGSAYTMIVILGDDWNIIP